MNLKFNVPKLSVLFASVLVIIMILFSVSAESALTLRDAGDVVWYAYDGNDSEIFLYSKGAVTQITDNNYDDWGPLINTKGQIVWNGSDGNDLEIFLYSKGAVTQLTNNDYDDWGWVLQINSKGQTVWRGSDGHDYEIFLYSNGIVIQLTDNDYDDYLVT